MVQGGWPPQPLDEWFGTNPHNGDVVNAVCDRWKRMLYRALKEIDNRGVAGSPILFAKQHQGVSGGGGVAQQRVRAHAPTVGEQTPQPGNNRQMLDFTSAESPLGRHNESFEEFWESLNKHKVEEGTSCEACIEGLRAPPPPIPQSVGKQPQRAKQFVKAVQAQVQDAKPKAKQAPKPKLKRSGVQSKKRKKVPNPDDSGDESSPNLIEGSDDSEDAPLPLKPPQTEKSKVKPKHKKPWKKTKKGGYWKSHTTPS